MNGNWGISRYKQGLLREEVNSRMNFNFTDLVIKILCFKRRGEANHHRENKVQILIQKLRQLFLLSGFFTDIIWRSSKVIGYLKSKERNQLTFPFALYPIGTSFDKMPNNNGERDLLQPRQNVISWARINGKSFQWLSLRQRNLRPLLEFKTKTVPRPCFAFWNIHQKFST